MKNQLRRILGLLLIAMVVLQPHATTGVKPASKELAEQAEPQPNAVGQAKQAKVQQAYGQLPLYFEANRGQADPSVKFLSRGRGYSLFLTSTDTVLTLREARSGERGQRDANAVQPVSKMGTQSHEARNPKLETVLRIQRVGANPRPQVVGSEQLPGKINYVMLKGTIRSSGSPRLPLFPR